MLCFISSFAKLYGVLEFSKDKKGIEINFTGGEKPFLKGFIFRVNT